MIRDSSLDGHELPIHCGYSEAELVVATSGTKIWLQGAFSHQRVLTGLVLSVSWVSFPEYSVYLNDCALSAAK